MQQKFFVISLTISSYLFSISIMARNFDDYNHIKKYVNCAALQYIIADILSPTEEDCYRHDLHYAAQDSTIVAMELVKASDQYT